MTDQAGQRASGGHDAWVSCRSPDSGSGLAKHRGGWESVQWWNPWGPSPFTSESYHSSFRKLIFEEYLKLGTPGLAELRIKARNRSPDPTPDPLPHQGQWMENGRYCSLEKENGPRGSLSPINTWESTWKGFLCPTAKPIAGKVLSVYTHTYMASSHPLGGSLLNMKGEPQTSRLQRKASKRKERHSPTCIQYFFLKPIKQIWKRQRY